jgi:hypothetical protein
MVSLPNAELWPARRNPVLRKRISLQTMLPAHIPHPRVPAYFRTIYRAQAIRKRLRGSINLSLPLPEKPKGLHWETYFRLCHEHDEWEGQSWPGRLLKRAAHNLINSPFFDP